MSLIHPPPKRVKPIESLVGCDERSIRKWAHTYQQAGLDGLQWHWSGENALRLSRKQRADVKQRLHAYRPDQVLAPDVRISRGQFWTVSDRHMLVKAWYDLVYPTADSYGRLLQESGLSYQRTEKIYRAPADGQTLADFEAELEKK